MRIRATHRISQKNQIVYIVSDFSRSDKSPKPLSMENIELKCKGYFSVQRLQKGQSKDLKWTMKAICEDDFLELMGISGMMKLESCHARDNSFGLELITVNSVKTPLSSCDGVSSRPSKTLGIIPSDDVIEVFV